MSEREALTRRTYTYRGVEVVIDFMGPGGTQEVEHWETLIDGWLLNLYTVSGCTLLARYYTDCSRCAVTPEGFHYASEAEESEDPLDAMSLLDVFSLRPGAALEPFSTGAGRMVTLDYRAVAAVESVPLACIKPYIDAMLVARTVYTLDRMTKLAEEALGTHEK